MMHKEHDFEKREPDLERNKSMMHRTILIKYILWLIFLYVEDNLTSGNICLLSQKSILSYFGREENTHENLKKTVSLEDAPSKRNVASCPNISPQLWVTYFVSEE